MPVPLNVGERTAEESDILEIRAVGIGPLGIKMVQLLSHNIAGITYHEIIPDVERESGDMTALVSFTTLRTSPGVRARRLKRGASFLGAESTDSHHIPPVDFSWFQEQLSRPWS